MATRASWQTPHRYARLAESHPSCDRGCRIREPAKQTKEYLYARLQRSPNAQLAAAGVAEEEKSTKRHIIDLADARRT